MKPVEAELLPLAALPKVADDAGAGRDWGGGDAQTSECRRAATQVRRAQGMDQPFGKLIYLMPPCIIEAGTAPAA